MNPDIFETAYFFSRIRVNRVLNHSGKWFEKAGCGFNERIHGFHVNGRSIRGKKRGLKRFGFNEQIDWFLVNDVNGGSFREKKKKRLQIYPDSCGRALYAPILRMRFEYESKNGLLRLFIFGFSSQSELLSDILYFIWQLQIEISREYRTGKY